MNAAQHRYLHVANGTSVTMTLEAGGVPGTYSIWADVLYQGPVPAGLIDDELVDVRARYHAGADWSSAAWGGADPSLDPVNDMRQWRDVIARHESYAELVLWFEHDLFDQLNLIQLLAWIRERLPPVKPVSLICIGSFPGRPDFKGLGELSADELGSLLVTRLRVTEAQYDLAGRAWQAFRAPVPESLDALRHEDTSALPYLGDAVARFLQEYPWTIDGLSRTERRLLELADGGGVALWKAFPRMGEGEQFYHTTDLWLAETASALSATSPPLLTLEPSATSDHPLRGTVRTTDTGRSILARRLDRVATCGIDRWLGGVHLHGRHVPWRWDDEQQRVIRVGQPPL